MFQFTKEQWEFISGFNSLQINSIGRSIDEGLTQEQVEFIINTKEPYTVMEGMRRAFQNDLTMDQVNWLISTPINKDKIHYLIDYISRGRTIEDLEKNVIINWKE